MVFNFISAKTQDVQFEAISGELGLSQNLVASLFQDSQGYIWAGTKNGLNRFDGYKFKVFLNDPFDTTTVRDNFIHAIYEDSQNRLWIGTSYGLNLFDRETERFKTIRTPPLGSKNLPLEEMAVTAILEDDSHRIWLGTARNGVILLGTPSDSINTPQIFQSEFTTNTISRNQVVNLIQAKPKQIWVVHTEYVSTISENGDQRFEVRSYHWDEILTQPEWGPRKISKYPF